jgi:hypothetical protein
VWHGLGYVLEYYYSQLAPSLKAPVAPLTGSGAQELQAFLLFHGLAAAQKLLYAEHYPAGLGVGSA